MQSLASTVAGTTASRLSPLRAVFSGLTDLRAYLRDRAIVRSAEVRKFIDCLEADLREPAFPSPAISEPVIDLLAAFAVEAERLGVGTDEPISGADAVDLLNQYWLPVQRALR
ncbi:hypothetical protein AACH06_25725 [Ideonella sp. DXS29W]|uniref:Uncharacterized protein n=1 Tax=Ideonella lacteola TaxID=2984193 RepID=A0ABU9BW85_9BURK